MTISVSSSKIPTKEQIITLYKSVGWTAAEKPDSLYDALRNSHSLVTAWDGDQLCGLGNAISDGHLVVYFPHLLVSPSHQKHGVGKQIVLKLQEKYSGFHMQMLTADQQAANFYQKMGFERAGDTIPMWIYAGSEH